VGHCWDSGLGEGGLRADRRVQAEASVCVLVSLLKWIKVPRMLNFDYDSSYYLAIKKISNSANFSGCSSDMLCPQS
jgi:hypothetical protein